MSIASAFAKADAHYRNRIITETYGHLFPNPSVEPIRGMIRIAQTAYSGAVILEEEIDIPNSPWWYTAIHDFLNEYDLEYGRVSQLLIDVYVKVGIQDIPYYSEITLAEETDGWDEWLIEYSQIKYYEYIHIEEVESDLVLESLT